MSANGHEPPPEWLEAPLPRAASPAVRLWYREVAAALGVPYLGPFWRALAWDDAVRGALWQALRPALLSAGYEAAARALRGQALIEEVASMSSHQAFRGDLVRWEIDFEMRERIANYTDTALYGLGKTLLAAAWLERLLAGEPFSVTGEESGDPPGVAPGAYAVDPVPPGEERGRVAELLEAVRAGHRRPFVDEYFRGIARAPDYLAAAWNALSPIVRDEAYDEHGAALARAASEAAARLPGPASVPPALAQADPSGARLRTVVDYFLRRHLPDTLIDLSLIKALTDGPEAARRSAYDR